MLLLVVVMVALGKHRLSQAVVLLIPVVVEVLLMQAHLVQAELVVAGLVEHIPEGQEMLALQILAVVVAVVLEVVARLAVLAVLA
jgi:hypothetical protein